MKAPTIIEVEDYHRLSEGGKRAIDTMLATNGFDIDDVFRIIFVENGAWVWYWRRKVGAHEQFGRHGVRFAYDVDRIPPL
jgi:hypothetical protein